MTTSNNPLLPDDPRLTAYALNEMEPGERAQFESLLQQDPAARRQVEEIAALGRDLDRALAAEPLPAADPLPLRIPAHDTFPRVRRFPYYWVSGLAAACFAIGFIAWQAQYQPPMRTQLLEVNLQPSAGGAGSAEPSFRAADGPAPTATATDGAEKSASEFAVVALPAIPASRKEGEAVATNLPAPVDFNAEAYDRVVDNPFIAAAQQPLSTFSIDVDTASYANVRRFLQGGARPPRDAVRIEELVNYFPYEYAGPQDRDMPFSAAMEVASAPWNPAHRLVRIGLKGREMPAGERPDANLVFLIDVSGSMQPENKLPLVKRSLRLLVEQLRPDDRVALAVYAGSAGLVLPSTRAADKQAILGAIDRLEAGGSTNGAMGIQLAYDIAMANFIMGGVNRLILCTDGDFNVGVTNRGDLVGLIEEKAKSGVFLTVLGFGMGNYKDATLEQLADRGNGNHGYVDSLREAEKLLVEQAGGTLVTIAKDVKIQVDFNPAQVQAYRLIGYENRLLLAEDFNNDRIDAGEIGAGHTVTALYEVVPVGVEWSPESTVDASKYQVVDKGTGMRGQEREGREQAAGQHELLTLKLRYKDPAGLVSRLREFPLVDGGARFEQASMDFRFAASVAAFGMILRDSPHKGTATLADVTAWASSGTGRDAGGYRTEFLGLVKLAEPLLK